LPEERFSFIENWLWFSGAGVCGVILLGCAYGAGVRSRLDLFQAAALGIGSWAFVFLTFRDCRRAINA
jgi:hypothetical protein